MLSSLLFDPISASRKQSLPEIAIEIGARLPWLTRTPSFSIGRHEGYTPGAFGARAGMYDDLSVQNVLHEIAHAIELKHSMPTQWKRRISTPNFGMRIKSYQTVMGDRYYEPQTTQATERECRVGAIQLHLLQAGGYDTSHFVGSFVRTLKYMADSYLGGDCILNAHDPEKYTPGEKKWVRLRTEWLEQEYARHTITTIQQDIEHVCQHLAKKKFEMVPEFISFASSSPPSPTIEFDGSTLQIAG